MPPVSDEFEPTGAGANLQSRYGLQDELLGARGRPRRRNDEPERVRPRAARFCDSIAVRIAFYQLQPGVIR